MAVKYFYMISDPFGNKYGCQTESLFLIMISHFQTSSELQEKMFWKFEWIDDGTHSTNDPHYY